MPEEIFLSKDTHVKTKKIEREVNTPADFTLRSITHLLIYQILKKHIRLQNKLTRDSFVNQESHILYTLFV